jgi:hypothetical protein
MEKKDIQTIGSGLPALSQADRLIELAVTSGGSLENLTALMALKERHDKEEARKAFTAALASFKEEDVTIRKDRQVGFESKNGSTSYMHASLGNIVDIAVPVMSKYGLSHRWEVSNDASMVKVICILTHSGGHSERTSLQAQPDGSGKKNAIQQVASTITYLERYTFLAIAGLAVMDQDDDGKAGYEEPEPVILISDDQANILHSMMTENKLNMKSFEGWYTKRCACESLATIPADLYDIVYKKIDATIKAQSK